jgi:hypothetical protein
MDGDEKGHVQQPAVCGFFQCVVATVVLSGATPLLPCLIFVVFFLFCPVCPYDILSPFPRRQKF